MLLFLGLRRSCSVLYSERNGCLLSSTSMIERPDLDRLNASGLLPGCPKSTMPQPSAESCSPLASDCLWMTSLLPSRGTLNCLLSSLPRSYRIGYSPIVLVADLLQAFAAICRVPGAVRAEATPRPANRQGIWGFFNVLCWVHPHLLRVRGTALELRQLSEQRGCGSQHPPDQHYNNLLCHRHPPPDRSSDRRCGSC